MNSLTERDLEIVQLALDKLSLTYTGYDLTDGQIETVADIARVRAVFSTPRTPSRSRSRATRLTPPIKQRA